LERYGRDLTYDAQTGQLDRGRKIFIDRKRKLFIILVVTRHHQIQECMKILFSQKKNIILTGQAVRINVCYLDFCKRNCFQNRVSVKHQLYEVYLNLLLINMFLPHS
jgi:hypothetical protein